MYQNYIFDLYGTLIDIRTDEWSMDFWQSYADWLGERGMKYSALDAKKAYESEVAKALAKPSAYTNPEIDIFPVFESLCRKFRPEISETEIYQAGEEFRIRSTSLLQLYPNTLVVLDTLKKAGKKIYLLSNAQRVFTWRELELTGILGYFDDVFISSDAGCKKPDPSFYQMLLNKHNLKPEESVMIGNDGSSDIAGANLVGMDGFYVRTAISPEGEPVPSCKYVFEDGDIGHVLELIQK